MIGLLHNSQKGFYIRTPFVVYVSSIPPSPNTPEAEPSLLSTNVARAHELIIIARPITPAKMNFLASPTFVSSPPEVIHLNPPIRMITTATIPNKLSATLIISAIVVVKSFFQ